MTSRTLIPAALLLFGCSLHRRAAAPEPARGPARDSLFQLDQSRADSVAARGPVDGSLALLGADAVYLRAGVPAVYGLDAARTLIAASAASSSSAQSWQPLGGAVSRDLRDAYTFGVAARLAAPRKIELERYVAYWRRDRSQPWRIIAYVEVGGLPGAEVALSAQQLAPPVRQRPAALAAVATQVRVADSLFSDLADRMGTAVALAQTLAPDGVQFGGSQLLVGPRAAADYVAAQPPGTSLTWRPVFSSASASADLGFTVGESISTGRGPSGAAVQRFGKYLTVWRRQPNGSWKVGASGGNETPPKAEK